MKCLIVVYVYKLGSQEMELPLPLRYTYFEVCNCLVLQPFVMNS